MAPSRHGGQLSRAAPGGVLFSDKLDFLAARQAEEEEEEDCDASTIFDRVDSDGDGVVSKLDFIAAMQGDRTVNDFVLPGLDSSGLMSDEQSFDAVDAIFEAIAGGKHRVTRADFAAHFRQARAEKTPKTKATRVIFNLIDSDGDGSISKLDFIAAMQRDPAVDEFVLPGCDSSGVMSDENSFNAVDNIFEEIAGGKKRISYDEFEKHFQRARAEKTPKTRAMRAVFNVMDADGDGSVSKLGFIAAMQQNAQVNDFVLPGADTSQVLSDQRSFDAIDAVFDAIASGKRRIEYSDFEKYFRSVTVMQPKPPSMVDRAATRVLIVGPGFGRELNPQQGRMIEQAGFQVTWCSNVPNPEQPNFPVAPYLGIIRAAIDRFQPHIVACASKGGVYAVGLWQMGYWRGPTVLLNAHPTCVQLPAGVPVVLAQGSNDEVYPTNRAELEKLMSTGTENRCFLYYTADSGELSPGVRTRRGDHHNMDSLLANDCLPRLIDAALCPDGPEISMVRSWRGRLSDARLASELWLGYCPERLRRLWASTGRAGREERPLFQVPPGSEEFLNVEAIFKEVPREAPAYEVYPRAAWEGVRVLRVERVENGLQGENSVRPYYQALRASLGGQGLDFEPGTHSCWAFHGAQPSAVDSIVTNPVAGFQPLASGTRTASLWGSGTYFARDAQYVAGSHFCGPPGADGSRQMLMCLLMTGMPCLGDPDHKGVLPFRQKPHRYNSSVDSLSSPEIYVIQHPGAACPAYLITFA